MFASESPSASVNLPLLRVPAGRSLEIALLSTDWIRLDTHYFHGTVLCAGEPDCELCVMLPSRPYWYLPVRALKSRRITLLELSPRAAGNLEQLFQMMAGDLATGRTFEVRRKKAKSALSFSWIGDSVPSESLELHHWGTALMSIYRLPWINVGETIEQYGSRVHRKVCERAAVLAGRVKTG